MLTNMDLQRHKVPRNGENSHCVTSIICNNKHPGSVSKSSGIGIL
jgi:hypothetical protein